ncbi:coiled-coil domain-containing protein 130 homolog [Galendromus occidentalis]|uniref:Coiled-coil domain-containing protein 130 homolog n=1 Tax=Galendromus occidentalis TaxID=34638 RepID=A0AAJ7L7Q7_9ACAR|nr:coiled-coil domain-containing protein 130 homolog [Galendromus occidentalis]
MAERKATNKYYPPDWDPSKGSINTYRKSHPLRERAKKLHMGILVIRFEMPYNIWCEGCKNHIGTGVRYNAEKSKVGMYYTTPVYKFRMKCHLCDNHIEMQTDPGNLDYIILSGASRQERRWDPTENGQVVPEDKNVSKQLASDPMFKLEHAGKDSKKKLDLEPVIEKLEDFQDRWRDNYSMNCLLRKKFRVNREKKRREIEAKDKLLKSKAALNIKLLPESDQDREIAQLLRLEAPMSFDERQRRDRRELMSKPLLGASTSSSNTSVELKSKILNTKSPRTPPISDGSRKLYRGLVRNLNAPSSSRTSLSGDSKDDEIESNEAESSSRLISLTAYSDSEGD